VGVFVVVVVVVVVGAMACGSVVDLVLFHLMDYT